ncbi:MAG: bifunctional DNA-formamidopyrimidine glycosylase/DNA-(apurinic or apyrimidinic site) lyase [Deltaproteobacteria bacterium]|jgi:formamidopyrimidine-DNA glycosylase|nr:bifunctional DNA-formamidopyrimidine glycosylase/DNA-(apurinic or apyrimidinic site) lyase [Deltaproteobacteria bacterium]
MPELPEAETMARELMAKTRGWLIAEVLVNFPPIVASDFRDFTDLLKGREILKVGRVGKWIHFGLEGDHDLLVHLKMTGQFHFDAWPGAKGVWPAHCHAAFRLTNPKSPNEERTLFYKDTRKFGRLRAFGPGELEPFLTSLNLGPDALTATHLEYHQRLSSRKGKLKAVLLDQSVLAGFGNIYADETLLAAKLSPIREAKTLSLEEASVLKEEAREILTKAIECRGSTVSSYQAPEGAGSYQDHHKAYGQAGQPCPFCEKPLKKTSVGGRTTVYCPFCQK